MRAHIALIEDDADISKMLSDFLTRNGCTVTAAYDGSEATKLLREPFDLILMDLMLPGRSGESLLTELRTHSDTPVIVISARSMLETRLEVLRIGADDYILKPFDLNEVLVRIEVVLRRAGGSGQPELLSCGKLRLYPQERRVCWGDTPIALTGKELQLLQLFLEQPKRTYTKANLYELVWNAEYCEDSTINVHVSNLRAKLKKASGTDLIETVWGIGYRLRELPQ